ncbi:hypothetical protein [Salinithrix halophila]|uniref:Uncharacterized protein n=1 Tax=Salinithrix halophila TaxID=1485204 RepID=A0ABV8JAT9_9BACL
MSPNKKRERKEIDRMVDEGLGGGRTGSATGQIDNQEELEQKWRKEQVMAKDIENGGLGRYDMEIDRMVNEGLGGGRVGEGTGRIEESDTPRKEED